MNLLSVTKNRQGVFSQYVSRVGVTWTLELPTDNPFAIRILLLITEDLYPVVYVFSFPIEASDIKRRTSSSFNAIPGLAGTIFLNFSFGLKLTDSELFFAHSCEILKKFPQKFSFVNLNISAIFL